MGHSVRERPLSRHATRPAHLPRTGAHLLRCEVRVWLTAPEEGEDGFGQELTLVTWRKRKHPMNTNRCADERVVGVWNQSGSARHSMPLLRLGNTIFASAISLVA
jgi:hypothetical protein